MELTGKNVFITGSTRGIGAAVALAFAKAGANIVLNVRKAIPEEKINEIKAQGVNCIGVSGDISDYEKAGLMVEEAEKQLGSIDILMKKREGAIINLSSVSGLIGNVGQANYAASKAGVVGFTKSVAREAAARGVTCNAIAPGFIATDMTEVLSDKVKEQVVKQIPMQRFGSVEDVANAAIFLAESPYITGQVINVDGGLVMHG